MTSEHFIIAETLTRQAGAPPSQYKPVLGEWNNRFLFGAWYGTAFAGAVFGTLLFVWELVLPLDYAVFASVEGVLRGLCQFLLGCFAGLVIGTLWAGFVGLFVCVATIILLWTMRLPRAPLWLASFFGGSTAFLCCGRFAWVAVTIGQLGAVWVAAIMLSGMKESLSEDEATQPNRFGLAQVFRTMTLACICFGIMSLMNFSDREYAQMGYCLLWQCAIALLLIGAPRLWAKRST